MIPLPVQQMNTLRLQALLNVPWPRNGSTGLPIHHDFPSIKPVPGAPVRTEDPFCLQKDWLCVAPPRYLLQAAPDVQGAEPEHVQVGDLGVNELPDGQPLMA